MRRESSSRALRSSPSPSPFTGCTDDSGDGGGNTEGGSGDTDDLRLGGGRELGLGADVRSGAVKPARDTDAAPAATFEALLETDAPTAADLDAGVAALEALSPRP